MGGSGARAPALQGRAPRPCLPNPSEDPQFGRCQARAARTTSCPHGGRPHSEPIGQSSALAGTSAIVREVAARGLRERQLPRQTGEAVHIVLA
jgi:hypothetical protein